MIIFSKNYHYLINIFKKKSFYIFKTGLKIFNKPKFMSFACGATCRTFVLSIRTSGGDTEKSGWYY